LRKGRRKEKSRQKKYKEATSEEIKKQEEGESRCD
jgi:hypothetical protein